jgi:thymidylate synthase
MHLIKEHTANDLYRVALRTLSYYGEMVSPRGMKTIELSPSMLELTNPYYNIITDLSRKASKSFMAAELLWILMGREDLEMLQFYNSQMAKFSDDGKTLSGAYGPRIMYQFEYVYNTLKNDPDSRQAVITIWDPVPLPSKDIPCTVMLHFLIRDHKLLLYAYMRSNDAWLGFPYDLHNFTCLQIIMAKLLGIQVGSYFHFTGSFHIYEDQFENLKKYMEVVRADAVESTKPPEFVGLEGLENSLKIVNHIEEKLRGNDKLIDVAAISNFECPFFRQKLQWLAEKAEKKHANTNR